MDDMSLEELFEGSDMDLDDYDVDNRDLDEMEMAANGGEW